MGGQQGADGRRDDPLGHLVTGVGGGEGELQKGAELGPGHGARGEEVEGVAGPG